MVQFLPVLESSTDLLLIQFQVLEASTDPVPVGAASRVSVASFETSHDKMNIFGAEKTLCATIAEAQHTYSFEKLCLSRRILGRHWLGGGFFLCL